MKTIIVVDDSAFLRDRISEVILGISGYGLVAVAENGDEAIQLINLKKPDHVTLDIKMPGKSGIEVLKAIKPVENNIVVTVITNHADSAYRKACLKLGASHFLDKTKELQSLEKILLQYCAE